MLHKLRMTHKKVPAVQLLIIAMLYQARAKRRGVRPAEKGLRVLRDQVEQIRLTRHADHAAQPLDQILSARVDGARRAGRPILGKEAALRRMPMPCIERRAADIGAPHAGFPRFQTKVDGIPLHSLCKTTSRPRASSGIHSKFVLDFVYNIHLTYKSINRHF